jgi:hypothetical protein
MPKNNVIVEIDVNGVWIDITGNDEVFTDTPITITQGQNSEDGGLRPSQISMRLQNANDKYRVSNPLSPLYRLVGRNTPIRVSVGNSVRGIAEINSWKCDQTRDFRATPRRGKSWTDITAGGILYRINKWTKSIRSPLYRYITQSTDPMVEYWDMEVPSGGSEAPSVNGGTALQQVTEVRYTLPDGSILPPGGVPDFGKGNKIPGSAPLPSFQNGGTLAGPIRSATFDGYAIDWIMQFEAGSDGGGTATVDVLNWTESGTYVSYTVNVIKGFVTVFHANAADAATLTSTGSAVLALDIFDGSIHHFRYQVRQNGVNYSATLWVDSSLSAVADNFVPGMAGTVGVPKYIQWNPGEDRGDYMPIACGHLIVWASGQLGDQPPVYTAINGWSKELTAERFDRIFNEENITNEVIGTDAESVAMGPQKPDTLFNLTQELKTTEDGLIYDSTDDLSVEFKLLNDRYNQTPVMTLYPTDFPALPPEVTDDLDTHNFVTVKQRDGGEATAEDSTSFLGTQDPPDGIGEEKDEVNVNLFEPVPYDLQNHANWWMRRGTVDLPRYPQITLDLNANPQLITAANALQPGDVIQIVGMRENAIRLFVLGWTEVIGTHSRVMTLVCKPDQQFVVGIYDNTNYRYDLETCVLTSEHSISATTLNFTMTNNESWSSTSAFELFISGERIYVPAGGMAAKSGTGPYTQVATGVTRGVNGISKVLPINSEVHVATPGRYAL